MGSKIFSKLWNVIFLELRLLTWIAAPMAITSPGFISAHTGILNLALIISCSFSICDDPPQSIT